MAEWSDPKTIKQNLLQKWDSGRILGNSLEDDGFFPWRIKLKGPTTGEMNTHFAEMLGWIKRLRSQDKHTLGYGYILEEKEVHHRLSGKNLVPTHAVIPTIDDGVQLLGKQKEMRVFKENASALLQEWPALQRWVLKRPLQVVAMGENFDALRQVLRWFAAHEQRDIYLRQLDIPGVDTKFIEAHKGLLTQLLDIVLPQDQVELGSNGFEQRYGLKTRPNLIRFRILDNQYAVYGCTDISLPLGQFGGLDMPLRRVFIVENEINFLSFPEVPEACVIFGAGYRADSFRAIRWLRDQEIYYWGDIDTHGFHILSMVRHFLPQTQSFLMSEDILLAHRSLWSKEAVPFKGEMAHLTPAEQALAGHLQKNYWGEGVRLEQERIRYSLVERFVAALR